MQNAPYGKGRSSEAISFIDFDYGVPGVTRGSVNRIQFQMSIELKPYRANWSGQVVLACRKCHKKLKKDGRPFDGVGLKKAVRVANKRHRGEELHVINVPCMDLCPKDGVTVCLPSVSSEQLFILRDGEDLGRLYAQGQTSGDESPE